MALRDIREFSAEEVALWLTLQGLGEKADTFIAEGVDGNLLVTLTPDELKNDLGLSGLQAKKVMKNIEFTRELGAGSGGGEESEELEKKVRALKRENEMLEDKVESLQGTITERDAEIRELRRKLDSLTHNKKESPQPVAYATPAPVHHHAPAPAPQRPPQGMPVVRNAAVGTATGAAKGAVIGAILPGMDARDGAAAGAAAGALGGGMQGLAARRRMRR